MELLAFLCLLGLTLAVALVIRSERRRLAYWRRVASERGLGLASRTRISGTREGRLVEVRLKSTARGHRGRVTEIRVKGARPSDLRLGKGRMLARLKWPRAETGDPDFDARLEVGGEQGLILALFDGPTRAVVLEALHTGWDYESSGWRVTLQGAVMKGLGEAIDIGLRFAGALETPGDVAERLCERASKDPSMDARVMCLSKLLERFPDGPATRRALEYARGPDASVQMRLVAGRALGDVGLLAKAANSLLETREAADASTIEAASAALELLGRRYPHAPEAEGALRGWLDSGAARDPRSKRALVEALGDIHHPEAGRHLLDALSSHEGEAIQCAAMASLGRVGTLEAVPHLLPYRDKMFSVVLKAAARDAIQKIQLRSRSAPGGSLSLATDEVGALAIVRDKLP